MSLMILSRCIPSSFTVLNTREAASIASRLFISVFIIRIMIEGCTAAPAQADQIQVFLRKPVEAPFELRDECYEPHLITIIHPRHTIHLA